ncbi:uncharacterized protein [Miscanthus floridulus]|uniref:uncharacterized protein n=1 Tax=Miscanthus floridulus TaxID=154761 RepID=UPI003458E335
MRSFEISINDIMEGARKMSRSPAPPPPPPPPSPTPVRRSPTQIRRRRPRPSVPGGWSRTPHPAHVLPIPLARRAAFPSPRSGLPMNRLPAAPTTQRGRRGAPRARCCAFGLPPRTRPPQPARVARAAPPPQIKLAARSSAPSLAALGLRAPAVSPDALDAFIAAPASAAGGLDWARGASGKRVGFTSPSASPQCVATSPTPSRHPNPASDPQL